MWLRNIRRQLKGVLGKGVLAFAMVALFALGTVGCSDDAPPGQNKEAGVEDSSPVEQGPRLDNGQTKEDIFVWPDSGKQDGASDLWPNPGDAYSGTPFGCVTDADCFGLTCCSTPWGVKVCAKSCN